MFETFFLYVIFMIMGRPFIEKKRIMKEDGNWHYLCSSCKEYVAEYMMTKNRQKPFNVDIYCLDCKRKKNAERNATSKNIPKRVSKEFGTRWIAPTGEHLNLRGQTPSDKMMMIQFFEKIGYDLSQPIYKQFQKRIEEKYGVILDMDDIPYQNKEKKGK